MMKKQGTIMFLAAVGVMVLVSMAQATPVISDPVIYYSFDSFGAVVADESGHGHNGTVNGTVTADTGKAGGGAKFTSGSFLDLNGSSIPAADIPTSEFTLSAWVKTDATGDNQAIFNALASDSTWVIHPELRANGQYRLTLRGNGSTVISNMYAGTVDWGNWVHYAGTYNRATGKITLYINGQQIAQVDKAADVDMASNWNGGARVGYNVDNQRPFSGTMDEFYIFKRCLSANEIGQLAAVPEPVSLILLGLGGLALLRRKH